MFDFYSFFIAPFVEYSFLRRPLVACLALAVGCGPVGVFLVLRRMILMCDALSHAIFPGAAIGFLLCGLSLPAMSLGGFLAGLLVVMLSGIVTRYTALREDASFAGFYLISFAIGILIISKSGGHVDVLHVLFGTILSVDQVSLSVVAMVSSITLVTLAVIYRPLVLECYDSHFLRSVGGGGSFYHALFLVLVTLNLVASFQALGTLMALGIMMLPAVAARFWGREIWSMCLAAMLIALISGYLGLLLSYHVSLPSGPSIILISGILYVISLTFGRYGSLCKR